MCYAGFSDDLSGVHMRLAKRSCGAMVRRETLRHGVHRETLLLETPRMCHAPVAAVAVTGAGLPIGWPGPRVRRESFPFPCTGH
jgi:hypothetical protein